jgi:polysaccharide biosynthesis/export protein
VSYGIARVKRRIEYGAVTQFLVAGLVVVAVSGCARSAKFEPEKVSAATVAESLPEPGPGDSLAGRREYRIGPYDKLTVQVFGVSELDRAGQVDAAGYISLPLVGAVMAAGETATDLGHKLEALYGQRYLRNPQISVSVVEAISQQVTIDGAVTRPGIYPVTGNSTLMTTVASANGATEFARLDQVLIFRTINEKRMVARYSLAAIRGGQAPDPAIFGNDVVVIGSGPGKLNIRDLLLLTPVLGAFYQITR